MSATADRLSSAAPAARDRRWLALALAALAVYHLALALFMVAGAHSFYTNIGPFGGYNGHFIRDLATYNAAIGVGLAVAVGRPSWRVPVLAITAVQFALHTVNHLFDIGAAHPERTGYFDFFSLLAGTLLLVWMLRAALSDQAGGPPETDQGGSR
jgi:hypothetical protein